MMDSNIELLFPTALYRTKLGYLDRENVQEYFNNTEFSKRQNETFCNNDAYVLNNSLFSELRNKIQHHINVYAKDVYKLDSEFYITYSWLNVNPINTRHTVHNHMNSIFSGVYYITAPEGCSGISFKNPYNPTFLQFEPTEFNSINSLELSIEVSTDDLLIFPSAIYHEVKTNTIDSERISLAFNTFVKGRIGSMEHGTMLEIN